MGTAYSEVTSADRDVVAFIAAHLYGPTLVRLGIKRAWVAREGGVIVGVLVLRTVPFTALNYLPADPDARTFMRLFKLYRMATKWLVENGVKAVAAEVHDSLPHFQLLLRRLGFGVACPGVAGATVLVKSLEA